MHLSDGGDSVENVQAQTTSRVSLSLGPRQTEGAIAHVPRGSKPHKNHENIL